MNAEGNITTYEEWEEAREEAEEDGDLEQPQKLELPPPRISKARFGTLGELFGTWRYLRKRRRLAKEGYIKWILVDSTYPEPKFVKPDLKSGGIPEIQQNGNRYIFPKQAMMPSEGDGMWTVVHRKGEADPIPLMSSDPYAIQADALDEYINMSVASSPPSLLDKFDMDPDDLIKWAVGLLIFAAIAHAFLNGGFV